MQVQWYPRMGDIPGLLYTTPANVDASALPGFGAVPEVHSHPGVDPYLWWTYAGYADKDDDGFEDDTSYGTTASPAHEYSSRQQQERSPSVKKLRASLSKALELPGAPSDYHFAIQHVVQAMHARRYEDPRLLAEMEQLAWLDINLIQAAPDTVRYDNQGEVSYCSVVAFARLLDLYAREGLLADAIRVADIAEHFGADTPTMHSVRARAAAVAAEDPGQQP